jgi:hypothetical protein
VWSGPHDSDRWLCMQNQLDEATPKGQVHLVAPFQLYSDATLLDNKTAKAHPLPFTLVNVTSHKRFTRGIR